MAPRLDHNETGSLSPDQFLRLYRDLRVTRVAMDTAVANHRNATKRAKDSGVDLYALGLLEKMVKVESDQAGVHMRNFARYAEWTKADVGLSQLELFKADDQKPSAEVETLFDEQLALEQGIKAGRAREDGSINPHAVGTAAHAAWARGWKAGQAVEIMDQFSAHSDKPARQPTRRGRKSPAENPALEQAMADVAGDAPASTGQTPDPAFDLAAEEAAAVARELEAARQILATEPVELDPADLEQTPEPEPDPSNVFPIHAAKPTRKPRSPKADAAAIKAADRLTGDAVLTSDTAF